jgi:proline racemase
MAERRLRFLAESDGIRRLLMTEPRGHPAMSGAILQPSTRPDADCGVLYIEVSGCLPMCGHGTMGVATVLVETGGPRGEPITTGASTRRRESSWRCRSIAVANAVTIENVPSFCAELDASSKYGEGQVRHCACGGLLHHRTVPSWQ